MTIALSRIGTCVFALTVIAVSQPTHATPQTANPGQLESAIARADAALRAKKFDDAIAGYQEAQKLLEAKLADARAAKQVDTWVAALAEFNALVARANQALAAGRFADALDAFNTARAKLPDEFNKRQLDEKTREAQEKERVATLERQVQAQRAAAEKAAADRAAVQAVEAMRNRWAVPYEKALDAVRQQQWAQAVAALEQATAIDPVSQANKRVESTFTMDYFPQFYLFYAHVKLKQYDKARSYESASRPPKPIVTDAAAVFAEYNKAVQKPR